MVAVTRRSKNLQETIKDQSTILYHHIRAEWLEATIGCPMLSVLGEQLSQPILQLKCCSHPTESSFIFAPISVFSKIFKYFFDFSSTFTNRNIIGFKTHSLPILWLSLAISDNHRSMFLLLHTNESLSKHVSTNFLYFLFTVLGSWTHNSLFFFF